MPQTQADTAEILDFLRSSRVVGHLFDADGHLVKVRGGAGPTDPPADPPASVDDPPADPPAGDDDPPAGPPVDDDEAAKLRKQWDRLKGRLEQFIVSCEEGQFNAGAKSEPRRRRRGADGEE